MNKEARMEYMTNDNIPNLFSLLDNKYWKFDIETIEHMEEQLVGEYLEENNETN